MLFILNLLFGLNRRTKEIFLDVRVVEYRPKHGEPLLFLTQVYDHGNGTFKISNDFKMMLEVESIELLTSLIMLKPDNYELFNLSKIELLKRADLAILKLSECGNFCR